MRWKPTLDGLIALVVVPMSALCGQVRPRPAPSNRQVEITVALVGGGMDIRPVPLHHMSILRASDSITVGSVVTNLHGIATTELPAGVYLVRSDSTVQLDGKAYRWNQQFEVGGSGQTALELTNSNAVAVSSNVAPVLQRQVSPELAVYQQSRSSVFRVIAGLKSGSGFLVDKQGVVVTNAHVVAGEEEVTVMLDSISRVKAQILWRDRDQDVAVLRVNPVRVMALAPLPLAMDTTTANVEVGERVLAIGFPLHQEQTMTTGVVSNVRSGAIISDVNINHGNSGGPLLTLDGRVVAINAFGDNSDQGGPGISGSINIRVARAALDSSRRVADTIAVPDSTLLPILPREAIPVGTVRTATDSAVVTDYRKFDGFGFMGFQVVTATPVANLLRRRAFDADIARDRRRREARAGVPEEERYNEILSDFEWMKYVGMERSPVVVFSIQPKLGETGGSVLTRALLTGPYGRQTIRYKGDLQSVAVYRNNLRLDVLLAGRSPVQTYENNMWVDARDVAYGGVVALSPMAFQPNSAGETPIIHLCVADLKNEGRTYCKEVPHEIIATVWNEFLPWLGSQADGSTLVRADPKRKQRLMYRGPAGLNDEYGTPF